MKKRGFTLIELLVVIAIIALLMAIVMPALSGAKYHAKSLLCKSNVRQWAIMANVYAQDWDSKLPDQYIPQPARFGANVWDVSTTFITYDGTYMAGGQEVDCVTTSYGINELKMKYCPLISPQSLDNLEYNMDRWEASGVTLFIGYSWWVPRSETIDLANYFPVDNVGPSATGKVKHPGKTTDKTAVYLPILSDAVFRSALSAVDDLSDDYTVNTDLTYTVSGWLQPDEVYATHVRNGEVKNINLAYADTHVETHEEEQIVNHFNNNYKNFH